MDEHRDVVACQVYVCLDRGDAEVERRLEARQGVFRLEAAGAAMALQVEALHGRASVRASKGDCPSKEKGQFPF
jgi:hypothetical protein